jgi:hypothetical protein
VMRKGYRREAGSEGSAKQRCEPMNKNRIRGASAGRAAPQRTHGIYIPGAVIAVNDCRGKQRPSSG